MQTLHLAVQQIKNQSQTVLSLVLQARREEQGKGESNVHCHPRRSMYNDTALVGITADICSVVDVNL